MCSDHLFASRFFSLSDNKSYRIKYVAILILKISKCVRERVDLIKQIRQTRVYSNLQFITTINLKKYFGYFLTSILIVIGHYFLNNILCILAFYDQYGCFTFSSNLFISIFLRKKILKMYQLYSPKCVSSK